MIDTGINVNFVAVEQGNTYKGWSLMASFPPGPDRLIAIRRGARPATTRIELPNIDDIDGAPVALHIFDADGVASHEHPIEIVADDYDLVRGGRIVLIDRPYGSISLRPLVGQGIWAVIGSV